MPNSVAEGLLELLDDPASLWREAFEKHLSQLAQQAFLHLTLMPRFAAVSDLHRALTAGRPEIALEVDDALKAIDDTFISIVIPSYAPSTRWVTFKNPSHLDFAQARLEQTPELLGMLTGEAIFFEQIANVIALGAERSKQEMTWDYPAIHSWVRARLQGLLTQGLALVDAPAASSRWWGTPPTLTARLAVLYDALADYSLEPTESLTNSLRDISLRVLDLWEGGEEEDDALAFVGSEVRSQLMSNLTGQEPTHILLAAARERPESVDRYRLLLRMDTAFGIPGPDLMSMREDFPAFVEGLSGHVHDMGERSEIRQLAREVEEIGGWLQVIVEDFQTQCDQRLEELPADEYEEEEEDSEEAESDESDDDLIESLFDSLVDRFERE